MGKKEARENANFTNFGYFETMLPVMTEESRKKNIDILNKAERPKYLLDHEVPENFNLLNFGQYSDLCDAMGGNNDVDMLKAIVKAVYPDATDEQIEAESVFKVFGFCNFAAREIDRINKIFGSIEVECSDEERRAGIGKVQFGTFGILDWYAAGVANAQAVGFPASIPAIATTIAVIMANIATAISTVKSAKFAKGGVNIQGAGTGTSDSINARISTGESVMTAKATQMYGGLLMIMNDMANHPSYTLPSVYSGNAFSEGASEQEGTQAAMLTEVLTKSLTAAMREMRPVVSVEEIRDVTHRVEAIESLNSF